MNKDEMIGYLIATIQAIVKVEYSTSTSYRIANEALTKYNQFKANNKDDK